MLPEWPELTPDAAREAIRLLVRHGHKVGAYVGNATAGGITLEWVQREVAEAMDDRLHNQPRDFLKATASIGKGDGPTSARQGGGDCRAGIGQELHV